MSEYFKWQLRRRGYYERMSHSQAMINRADEEMSALALRATSLVTKENPSRRVLLENDETIVLQYMGDKHAPLIMVFDAQGERIK